VALEHVPGAQGICSHREEQNRARDALPPIPRAQNRMVMPRHALSPQHDVDVQCTRIPSANTIHNAVCHAWEILFNALAGGRVTPLSWTHTVTHLTFKPSMQYVPMGHTELLLRKDGSAVSGEL
jgi:hypothetical protein